MARFNGSPNVAVKLDKSDFEVLEKLTEREGVTRSEVIRRAIRKIAREAGLLPPKEASVL
jgi:metal-responsive CopG/Arc/MetJ family transcriptional regulator